MDTSTAMALVYLVFIASAVTLYFIYRKIDEFKHYEFHNQSESGATTFDTYEEAKSFRRREKFYRTLYQLVGIPAGISLFIIFMSWMMAK